MGRICFWILSFCFSLNAASSDAVTYELKGVGRFGDCLLSYLHAKWFAYQNHLPLYYKPFPYSKELVLHDRELSYGSLKKRSYVSYNLENGPARPNTNKFVIYVCPYAPEQQWELDHLCHYRGNPWVRYDVDWKDAEFRKIVRELITPKRPLDLTLPPKGFINIALHVREGGGFDLHPHDLETGSLWYVLKFPPYAFYIEGICRVTELFPGKQFYCHLFTDAANPQTILENIKKGIPEEVPIVFSCRNLGNRHDQHVLEDFFSLFHYDILVCSQSGFAITPSLIHDFAVVYAPTDFVFLPNQSVQITDVRFDIDEKLCHELRQK